MPQPPKLNIFNDWNFISLFPPALHGASTHSGLFSRSCQPISHFCDFLASCWVRDINIILDHSLSLLPYNQQPENYNSNIFECPFPPRHPSALVWLTTHIVLPSLHRCHLIVSLVSLPMLLFHPQCRSEKEMSFALNDTSIILHIALRMVAKYLAHVSKMFYRLSGYIFLQPSPSTKRNHLHFFKCLV